MGSWLFWVYFFLQEDGKLGGVLDLKVRCKLTKYNMKGLYWSIQI